MPSAPRIGPKLDATSAGFEETTWRHQLPEHLDERQVPDVAVIGDDRRLDAHDPERRAVERRLAGDVRPRVHLKADRLLAQSPEDEPAVLVVRRAHGVQRLLALGLRSGGRNGPTHHLSSDVRLEEGKVPSGDALIAA